MKKQSSADGLEKAQLSKGFARATPPLEHTITTDMQGLEAGAVFIPVEDGNIPAYRAMPAGEGPFPTVLVVHEIFGVHEHIQDVCRRLAKLGYLAVAPEMYLRQGDVSVLEDPKQILGDVVSRVPTPQVLADLDATVAWCTASGAGDTERVAITGFCWGGRIVWLYAAHNATLKAGCAWYGRPEGSRTELQPRQPIDVVADLAVPVLGLYGGQDAGIPLDSVRRLEDALQEAQAPMQIVVYPDAPHGFFADYRAGYQPESAGDGWVRMISWFKRWGV